MNHCVLLVDDEELALEYLQELLEPVLKEDALFADWEIVCAANADKAERLYEQKSPMLVFLDINMPGDSGMDLAKRLRGIGEANRTLASSEDRQRRLPAIVFCTAHGEHGADAFQVHAIDYLMKPASQERVKEVVMKFKSFYQHELLKEESYVTCHHNGVDKKIALRDILYFKADQKYTIVKTLKHEFLISTSLIKLEERFPHLLKVHRAYLINPSFIERFIRRDNHWLLVVKETEEKIPVSRRQKSELGDRINFD